MKTRIPSMHRAAPTGFTLVELIVSTALIGAIMLMMLQTVDQTQRVWQRSQSKTVQFQAARAAFETMSRRLSQATLNTYWRAREDALDTEISTFKFRRLSELQFISAPTTRFLTASPRVANLNDPAEENYPSHAVFFCAPLGHTEFPQDSISPKKFRNLNSALSACGYFIEFGDDPFTPAALKSAGYPPRYRYRLMELTVPTERFNIYARPTDDFYNNDPRIFDEGGKQYYTGMVDGKNRRINSGWSRPYWMKEALARSISSGNSVPRFTYSHPLAENIIALIVLPKLAVKDRTNPPNSKSLDPNFLELAPDYIYDSWRVLDGKTEPDPNRSGIFLDNRVRDNLLPPIVQVTMVAIDEASASRLALNMSGKPDWLNKPSSLFQRANTEDTVLQDIAELEKRLRGYNSAGRIAYRIFSTDVVIRGSKWSRDFAN